VVVRSSLSGMGSPDRFSDRVFLSRVSLPQGLAVIFWRVLVRDRQKAAVRRGWSLCSGQAALWLPRAMSSPNAMLDICNSVDGGNLWFVVALLGIVGLNLLLTGVLFMLFCVRGGGSRGGGAAAAGGREDFDDVQSSPAKGTGGGGGGFGGGDLKNELLAFKRQLEAMDRKIDNKRVNEITASYMLHNAHDAIGNKVPTASQVCRLMHSCG